MKPRISHTRTIFSKKQRGRWRSESEPTQIFRNRVDSTIRVHEVRVNVDNPDNFERVPIQFQDFGERGIAEIIRDPKNPQKLKILLWKRGVATIHENLTWDGCEFVPVELHPSVLEEVALPSCVSPVAENAQQLIDDISNCIGQYIDIEQDELVLASHFVLATWFPDVLPVAPYLSVAGPYGAGKSTFVSLFHSLCRRAIRVVDLTPPTLYRLPKSIVCTLLIDEFSCGTRSSEKNAVLSMLRSGTTRVGGVFRGERLYKTFCAKVLASRQGWQDAALSSRCITIALRPTRKDLRVLDHDLLQKIADEFQPRLFAYRLRHYWEIQKHFQIATPDFLPRTKDLARALSAPLLGDRLKINELFSALARQDHEAMLNRFSEPEWVVAIALYRESHRAEKHLTMGSLALTVADVIAANGETYSLSPRALGEHVRAFGLRTCQLGNQGRGLILSQHVRLQMHEIALGMGINRSDLLDWSWTENGCGGYLCSMCESTGLMTRREDGVKLRSMLPRKPPKSRLFER